MRRQQLRCTDIAGFPDVGLVDSRLALSMIAVSGHGCYPTIANRFICFSCDPTAWERLKDF